MRKTRPISKATTGMAVRFHLRFRRLEEIPFPSRSHLGSATEDHERTTGGIVKMRCFIFSALILAAFCLLADASDNGPIRNEEDLAKAMEQLRAKYKPFQPGTLGACRTRQTDKCASCHQS